MAKKQQSLDIDFSKVLGEAIQESLSEISSNTETGLMNILDFCDHILAIDFSSRPFLRLILKMWYMNTPGCESLKITDEDLALIDKIDNYGNGNPWLKTKALKLKNGEIKTPFKYFVGCLGRRSGKTFYASIVEAYDAYKLLYMNVCPKCKVIVNVRPKEPCPKCGTATKRHPQAYFGQSGSEPMRIIMAATALDQAVDPGLKFFQERVLKCSLFDNKCELETERVFFKTDYDKEINLRFGKASRNEVTKGSIVARAIAANSKGIHGLSAVLVAFDEFALFGMKKSEAEGFPDEQMLEALVPATSQFEVRHPEFGRVMMISAPQFRQGKFYEFFKQSQDTTELGDKYLMVQMPTWEWCNDYTKQFFIEQFSQDTDSDSLSFDKVYGAQFVDESENSYLPEEATERAFFYLDIKKKKSPDRRTFNHYMHIDCAYNTCNYAYCIVHTESRFCEESQKMETFYVQDTSYFWAPSKNNSDKFVDLDGNTCEVSDIWEEIVKAAKSFHVISVSYDNMQTPESKSFFRKHGLPLRTLSFANKLKSVYYGVVKNAIHEKKIACCCDDHRLRNELLNLKVKYTERGPKIFPNPNGVVKTMDVSDCLAGACYLSTEKTCRRITRGSLMSGGPGIVGGMNVNNVAGQSIFMRELPNIRSYNGG